MPGAGLHLPDTLTKSLDQTKTQTVRHSHSERNASQDSGSDRTSIALPQVSSENVAKVFSSLPAALEFSDCLSTQGKVSSGNEVFADLLQRVRHDVTEASRLYGSKAVTEYFESWPDRKVYIDRIVHDRSVSRGRASICR